MDKSIWQSCADYWLNKTHYMDVQRVLIEMNDYKIQIDHMQILGKGRKSSHDPEEAGVPEQT